MDTKKLSRTEINKLLDTVPQAAILGKHAKTKLTPKQRKFALEIAKGAKGAEAYRRVYSDRGKAKTQGDHASRLKQHAGVAAEIEAYRLALEAAEYRTPAALRALVVQSLVQVLIDPESSHSARTNAARVLGTVTEVAAFTERREVRTVNDSSAAREQLLNEIKDLMRTVDVASTDVSAHTLLAELAGTEPHPPATTPSVDVTHHGDIHSTPHTQPQNSDDVKIATYSQVIHREDPPVDGTK
jgi:hypothetical protein